MPYADSYVWNIRQKIGHDSLIIPSADAIAVGKDGELLLVFNKDWNNWFFPGGYAEVGQSSAECAARELFEGAGVRTDFRTLIPFAFASGHRAEYPNGDITYPFTQYFITHEWDDQGDAIDEVEVSQRRWFSLEELAELELDKSMKAIIKAYKAFISTNIYQTIDFEDR